MSVTFNLRSKKTKKTSVVIIVSFRGDTYRKYVGESVEVKRWNDRTKRLRITAENRSDKPINDRLDKWEACAHEAMNYYSSNLRNPCSDEMLSKMQSLYYNISNESFVNKEILFIDYFEKYLDRNRERYAVKTSRSFDSTLKWLREYEKKHKTILYFDSINIHFYEKIKDMMYSRNLSDNYFGLVIRCVKRVFSVARQENIHSFNGIDHTDFVAPNKQSDSVYLTKEELFKMYELFLTKEDIENIGENPNSIGLLNIVRMQFIVAAFTGLRKSDFSRLNDKYISEDRITIFTQKTGKRVVIPLNPIVKEIIGSGVDIYKNIADYLFNNAIRSIARLAGLDNLVVVNKSRSGKIIEYRRRKWQLISSHTARRSFATNAYKSGVPPIAIMKITGHTQESTFMRYIRVTEEENAEMLMDHSFFKEL